MSKFRRAMQWVIGLWILVFLWAILVVPSGGRARQNHYRGLCQTNLKLISLACIQYTRDADNKFMPVSNGPENSWSELLQPYSESWAPFQCPITDSYVGIGYFFNSELDSLPTAKASKNVIVFGDGLDGNYLEANLWKLRSDALTNDDSFSQRHLSRANYAFADGHVKWLIPDRVGTDEFRFVP